MLPLPDFELASPTTLEEAVRLLDRHGEDAMLVAGGTDLLPNMKHGLFEPKVLVNLKSIRDLDYVREQDGELRLGSLVTIARLAADPTVRERLPSLAEAAGQIAGPQLRNMGTLGGNLCLDTRCVYYNQTHFWRRSLGYCLKKDGTKCFVVEQGNRCVAASSSDTSPVLMTLGGRVVLSGPRGEREIAVEELFRAPGDDHLTKASDEIVREVRVPLPAAGMRMGYDKLRIRKSIDYPIFSLALAFSIDDGGRLERFSMAATALGSRPKNLARLGEARLGEPLDAHAIEAIARRAQKSCAPLGNIDVEPEWRRAMIPVVVRRLFARLLDRPA